MWKIALCLCALANLASCQIEGYQILANFTCDASTKTSSELVVRTAETGTVSSPCYFVDGQVYPEEQTSGLKLVLLNFSSPFLHGYRLTIRDFDIADTDRLYIGNSTESIGGNQRAVRQFTLLPALGGAGEIEFRAGENGDAIRTFTLDSGNDVDLENFDVIYLDFYTVVDSTRGRGFLIDYSVDINKCLFTGDDTYCKNGGVCSRTGFNTASCNCDGTGYEGTTCTTDIDECTRGTNDCHSNADCTNTIGSFTCQCKPGFTGSGKDCTDINECPDGENTHICGDTGTCLDNEGSYTCVCNDGYENGDVPPCENINECTRDPNTCAVNATCEDTIGSFKCTCGDFFTGNGTVCTDIDECAAATDPCGDTGTCSNKVGGFDCVCSEGYEGGIGGRCTDIDECGVGTDDCAGDDRATCSNTVGSFTCACKTGFTGSGVICDDINECDLESDNCHDTLATCNNNNGSFTCTCITGYSGNGITCLDIDECATGTDDCHDNADCDNTVGSFTCKCKTGFTGDGRICADNDECARGEDNCDTNAECRNDVGSFECVCKTGFTGTGTAGNCANVNECSVDGTCHANADCEDNEGSFTCECKSGFSGDGITSCIDDNECTLGTDNCHDNATCNNIDGSFTCSCNTGFTGNGVTCSDINECTENTDNCNDVNGTCINNIGSFTCECKSGYRGDGIECLNIDECKEGTHNCVDSETTCRDTVGAFECICTEPRFRGSPGNCDYYCNETCLRDRNGFIEAPLYNDGSKTYVEFEEDFWNFQTSTTGIGIRFIFKRFSTEPRDDFLSIYPGDTVNVAQEVVGISGTAGAFFNEEEPVPTSGSIERPGSTVTAFFDLSGAEPTLTLSSSDLYIAFTSDRVNVSTGFLIAFEYDVDDCPATDPCANGGSCQDLPFDYTCKGCTGYREDKTCTEDINECIETFPCHANASCANTNGSFTCTCNEDYTGSGTTCNPVIALTNFNAAVTTTSITLTFDITERFATSSFISSFSIKLSRVTGTTFERTFNVNLTDFIADGLLISGLDPNTEYTITIEVVEGVDFGASVLQNDIESQTVFTADTNPLVPVNFAVASTTRQRVTLTWVRPVEIGFGDVTHYEVCYVVASDTTTKEIASLRSISTDEQCLIIDDSYTTLSFTDLPSYVNITFKMRAFSSAGPSDYTSEETVFLTSNDCEQWVNFASRATCVIDPAKGLQGLLASEGFPRDKVTDDNRIIRQEWSFDLGSYDAWRPVFVFFDIFERESTLDYGYGNDINPRIHDDEKQAQSGSFSGIQSGVGDAIVKNTSDADENLLWMTYISDRTRKSTGFQVEIQLDGNDCQSTPCLAGGTCTDGNYAYSCDCSATDYTGTNCEFPHVKPTVTCTPGKRDMSFTFDVQDIWRDDETVIGGYTVDLSSDGSLDSMNRNFGDARSGTFESLKPFTDYKVTVTVTGSTRDGAQYNVAMTADGGCKTLEDAPTVPRSVSVTPGVESLIVSWQAPEEPNGNVVYTVSHQSTDHETFGEASQNGVSGTLTGTSYTITGLRDYRTYDVTVRAQTGSGNSVADAVSERTSPGAPPAFADAKVTVLPMRSARVEWTLAATNIGPISVNITAEFILDGAVMSTTVTVPSTNSPYTFENLEEAQTYNFTLIAFTGTDPDQMRIVTGINTNASAPGLPASFTYDRATSTFSWAAPDLLDQNGVITSYVLKATTTVPGFTEQTFGADDNTFQLDGLPAFTKYTFTLQAVNSEGLGTPFEIEITTREDVPESVANVTEGEINATMIQLSWAEEDPPVGEITYDITYTDGTTTTGPINTAVNSYTLTDLEPFTTYTITIVAKSNAGAASSVEVTYQTAESTPTVPQNVAVTFAPYTITVRWEDPESPNGVITTYNVRVIANGETVSDVNVGSTSRTTDIQGISLSETTYTIQVSASTSAGQGVVAVATITTPVLLLNAPENVVVSDITNTTARINASPPDNSDTLAVENYVITISQDDANCVSLGDENCLSDDQGNTPANLPATISGLKAYRMYVLTVSARSAAGVGATSEEVRFNTTVGVPNQPIVTSITRIPGGVEVEFNAGTPFTGPAQYVVTATAGSDSENATVSTTETRTGLKATIRNLAGGTEYTITVVAENSMGTSGSSDSESVVTGPAAPTFTVARTSNTSLTVTITEVTGATSYTISHVQANCAACNATTAVVNNTTPYVISGLEVFTEYDVTVFASSAVGPGALSIRTNRTRAGQPTLIDPAYQLQASNQTEPSVRTSFNVLLENLCPVKEAVFNESTGTILRMAYITHQQGSSGGVNLDTFYGQVRDQNPSPPFLSLYVECDTSSRRKRTVTNNGVIIGADNTCPGGGTTVCNGPLKPSTTYTFQACGVNEEENYMCTAETGPITTDAAPESTGLTAGEIAAIVICSILLLILIILLIVYLVKRRRHQTGKHHVSSRGSENPSFDAKTSQQKYQVDPTADAPTEYSSPSA